MTENEPLAIYIHFLYCKSRCPYCDFFRKLKPRDFDENALVERYLEDIRYFAGYTGERIVKSIFFGGGTPSLLSPDAVCRVLDEISRNFVVAKDAEISLEANPNSFDLNKFERFHRAGINRLSLGVQALNDKDLKFLGRTHTVSEAKKAIAAGLDIFPKFSVDLIYARPNQTWEEWQTELDEILAYGLKHISLYQLSIEEGTVFDKKGVKALDEDMSLTLYNNTVSYLNLKGFERYEVSNFAVHKSARSTHNLVYWQGGDYIGIGEGAHGRIRHNGKIMTTLNGRFLESITPKERAEELLFMGLRIKEGINFKLFYQYSGIDFFDFVDNLAIKRLAQLNLLCYDDANIWLTDQGFLVLDKIVLDLLA